MKIFDFIETFVEIVENFDPMNIQSVAREILDV